MKNTITIDAKNSCACDLVCNIDDGSNRLFLEIHADISKNPILEINSANVDITEDVFIYEIDSSYWVGTDVLQFRIMDDNHTGEYFTIESASNSSGNIALKQVDNFNYELLKSLTDGMSIPIATRASVGIIKVGSGLKISADGTLSVDNSTGPFVENGILVFPDGSATIQDNVLVLSSKVATVENEILVL